MQTIKFCHLIDDSSFNPLLYNSVKFSDRQKFEYTVATLEPPDKLQKQMSPLGINFYSVDDNKKQSYFTNILRLIRFFRENKFDIVQVHSFEASLAGLIAARIARVPIRIFVGHHSHEVPLYNNRKLTFVDTILCKRLASAVLSPSEQMKQIFMEHQGVPEKKIRMISHGMDLEAWTTKADGKTSIKQELNIQDKIVFGAVGRLFWIKAYDQLIRAFAKIAKKNNDVVLLIVGDGSDIESLQNLINSLNMQKHIFLTGRRNDIANVMSDFDVFIHPALAESFGQVYIEAFALGIPIISTKVGVAEEIIQDGENGFLVNTNSEDELKTAMEKMIDLKGRWQEMGENGRRISENFSIETTQSICDDYYISLLNS